MTPLSNAARLREFHRALGFTSPECPTVPGAGLLALRRTLIREEVAEVEEEFDALESRLYAGEPVPPPTSRPSPTNSPGLLYVTYGALDALGIDADAVFAEVHRANLSEAGGPRRADGKQLKPGGWRPADLRG